MTLYWEEPCKPNGIITGYIVSYNITTRTANLHCPVEEPYMTLRMPTDSGCSGTEITEWSAKIYYTLIIVPNIRTIVR